MRSGVGTGVRRMLLGGVAVAVVACGRTTSNDRDDANGKGGRSASAGEGGHSTRGGEGGASNSAGAGAAVSAEQSATWQWKACGSLTAFQGLPVALAYASDDDLAVAYDDGRVLLYTEGSREPKRVLRRAGAPLDAIAFSANGEYFAEVARSFVHVRRVASDADPVALDLQNCGTLSVRFSADSDRLIGLGNGAVCVWRAADGALLHRIPGEFSSAGLDGDRLLAAYGVQGGRSPTVMKTITLPNLVVVTAPLEYAPGDPEIGSVEVSPRGDTLASAGLAFARGGLWSSEGRLMAPTNGPLMSYSPDGAFALIGDQLWDASSGTVIGTVPRGAPHPYEYAHLKISSSGRRGAQIRYGGQPRAATVVHDLTTGGQLRVHGSGTAGMPLRDLAISRDGNRLAVSTGSVVLWNVAPNFTDSHERAVTFADLYTDVEFSSADELLVSGDGWSVYSAEASLPVERHSAELVAHEPDCILTTLRASSRNQWLVESQFNRSLAISAREPRRDVAVLETPGCNTRVAFSEDDQYLATTGPALYRTSDWARVWPPLSTGRPSPSPTEGPRGRYQDVAFLSNDTELLASHCASATDACRHTLHSVMDGAVLRELPQLRAHRASVSPESHWVASGDVVLHLPSDTVRTLEPAPALAVFTPDGDVIGASDDGSLTRYCRTR